jgi:hypothetical protein
MRLQKSANATHRNDSTHFRLNPLFRRVSFQWRLSVENSLPSPSQRHRCGLAPSAIFLSPALRAAAAIALVPAHQRSTVMHNG